MLRARTAAAVLIALVVALLAAPALAGNGTGSGDGAPASPGDPCSHDRQPPLCAQAPEAPNALIYPAVGAGVVVLVVGLERRRRNRSGHPHA